MSLSSLVSRGTRFPAAESNVTYRPSPLRPGSRLEPFAWLDGTLTRSVFTSARTCAKTSSAAFVSSATRFDFPEMNPTTVPSSEIARAALTARGLGAAALHAGTRRDCRAATRTKTSMTELLSPATRFVADEVNTTHLSVVGDGGRAVADRSLRAPGRDAGTVGGAALAIANERCPRGCPCHRPRGSTRPTQKAT